MILCCQKSTKYDSITETMDEAAVIHGSSDDNNHPALDGLWLTLSKNCPADKMVEYFKTSSKVKNDVLPKLLNEKTKQFEKSEKNTIRSVSLFYSKGMVSKEK